MLIFSPIYPKGLDFHWPCPLYYDDNSTRHPSALTAACLFAIPSEVQAIASRSFRPRLQDPSNKRLRVNDFIRTPTVFLVDEDNEKIGVVNTDVAKDRAHDAGLDLVEVAPQAQPPVCRIMDYGKWKYQQSKKEQKAKSHTKQSELKEVRLRPKIDPHDLEIKTNKATEFLMDGNKVQFTMLFRGREMAHQDLGMKTMQGIITLLAPISKMETPPRMAGRRMTMIIAPDKVTTDKIRKAESKAAASKAAAAEAEAAPAPKPEPKTAPTVISPAPTTAAEPQTVQEVQNSE